MVHSWGVVSPWCWCRSSCSPHRSARRCTDRGTTPVPVAVAPTMRSRACPTTWAAPVGFAHLVAPMVRSHGQPHAKAPVTATAAGAHTHVVNVSYRRVVPAVPPTPTTSATVTAPVASAAPVHTPPAPVSVVASPPAPAPAPEPVTAPTPLQGASGLASWYGSPAGTCASPTLAFGTVVTVTDAGERGLGPVHGRRPRGPQPRAGHRPRTGHVLPAGEPGGGRDRGTPQLVSARRGPGAAPFVA